MIFALALLFAAQAHQPPAPGYSVIEAADWVRKPNPHDLAGAYPSSAARRAIGGRAVIRCSVEEAGTLTACSIISEAPVSLGFGEAALKLAPKFRMTPKTPSGQPVTGAVVMIPITFAP